MKKLQIVNVGPIKECKIEFKDFNVITGKQSAGKSTIAKSLYFFLSIKDELRRLVFEAHHPGILADGKDPFSIRFKNTLLRMLEDIYGSDKTIIREGSLLKMEYTEGIYIQVSFNKVLTVSYSNKLRDFIKYLANKEGNSQEVNFLKEVQKEINEIFGIDYSPVYIPAGRSLMTVMGNQFELFYSTLDDGNRRLIDLCTRRFFETVMRIKPLYAKGLIRRWKEREELIEKAQPYMVGVMNGNYYYANGDEYLELENGESIRVNMASSGQQEALWIYNILLYYSADSIKRFYIIEEPESNLFPESQQLIAKFLGFIANLGNPMLINTHSPYVLGELNNMIYAGGVMGRVKKKKIAEIIEKECQLDFNSMCGLFVEDGKVTDCMDYEIEQIDNSKLDAISRVINEEFDRLVAIGR